MSNIEYFWDIEQNSDQWLELRTGLVTCSEAKSILAKGQGKIRQTYMYKLAGERITGIPADIFTNKHMEHGHEVEPIARNLYQEQTGNQVDLCGFIKNGSIGYSPDGLIENGTIEIKRKAPHLLINVLLNDKIPSEHVAQIQCGLIVSERKHCDFIAFYPGMPLFIRRIYRDEKYINNLKLELEKFETELQTLIEKITKLF